MLGDSYTILTSRWCFVVEATFGSVLAYLILSRFIVPRLAFLMAVPTVFFSVLYYYFSNYTYDGAILAMLAAFLILASDHRSVVLVAGATACLAVLAKPPYAGLAVLVPAIGLLGARLRRRAEVPSPLYGIYRAWPVFVAGAVLMFILVIAAIGVAGGAMPYVQQAFIEIPGASARAPGFAIWQDLPIVFVPRELTLFAGVFVLLIAGTLASYVRLGWIAALAVAAGLLYYSAKYFHGPAGFLPMAMGLLLVMNGVALAISVLVRMPRLSRSPAGARLAALLPPPELIVIAVSMQYLAQFTFSGVIYSYLGAYLSVPIAIWFLYAVSHTGGRYGSLIGLVPAGLFSIWLIGASIHFVQSYVYFDQPRSELTAEFHTRKLQGIWSTPANVNRVDSVTALIDRYSKPGDRILAMTDFACIYFLTDRVNPTRQDWYLTSSKQFVPPSEVPVALRDLERDPPKVVILQTVTEFDWQRSYRPDLVIDWSRNGLGPIRDYIVQHYVVIAIVDDLAVMVPGSDARVA